MRAIKGHWTGTVLWFEFNYRKVGIRKARSSEALSGEGVTAAR